MSSGQTGFGFTDDSGQAEVVSLADLTARRTQLTAKTAGPPGLLGADRRALAGGASPMMMPERP